MKPLSEMSIDELREYNRVPFEYRRADHTEDIRQLVDRLEDQQEAHAENIKDAQEIRFALSKQIEVMKCCGNCITFVHNEHTLPKAPCKKCSRTSSWKGKQPAEDKWVIFEEPE